ncbi:hypothetical protein AB9P05_15935 [Roseivirga sp. BDSF3-8]|uniref:hypothetical protein n=1 Tax=Roseivirga sp. BDSF3-8 TaxID=3241598 RepID=UPI00353252B5
MAETKKTTDHNEIKKWAEEHDAKPVKVKQTDSDMGEGLVRLAIEGYSKGDSDLEVIGWSEFFHIFEENELAMIYEEGDKENFFKLVNRDN